MGCTASLALVNKNTISVEDSKHVSYDRFWEPDIPISDAEKDIVKSQWRKLSANTLGNGILVFLTIFKQHPEIKELFGCGNIEDDKLHEQEEIRKQAVRVMHAVGATVNNIDDLENTMSKGLFTLGKMHFRHTGFKPMYFEAFNEALTTVWRDVLGTSYTPACAEAWSHVFIFIFEKLKKGYHLASIEEVTSSALLKARETESKMFSHILSKPSYFDVR